MHVHILGVAGKFMAGIAVIAKQLGYQVSGSDQAIYPPMSDVLEQAKIPVHLGYDPQALACKPDQVIVGNALSRGNPIIEALLEQNLPFISGPQWLYQEVLRKKWVLAVSGTHGKTTTTSMLTWILEQSGHHPGYLIGSKPGNFDFSARLTDSEYFVIEADEYDTAFFDKRAKFLHYHPRTLIINNLEFDHADIYADIGAIERQFHHLVRTVPPSGQIIYPLTEPHVANVLAMGYWSRTQTMAAHPELASWAYELIEPDGRVFKIFHQGEVKATVEWSQLGTHNVKNGLAAIVAAYQIGVSISEAAQALQSFCGAARRMENLGTVSDITLFDDFAHHPTAIATTLAGLRARYPSRRLVCALELGSYTMRTGFHLKALPESLRVADAIHVLEPQADWDLPSMIQAMKSRARSYPSVDALVQGIAAASEPDDVLVLMSNGAFGGIQEKLPHALTARADAVIPKD